MTSKDIHHLTLHAQNQSTCLSWEPQQLQSEANLSAHIFEAQRLSLVYQQPLQASSWPSTRPAENTLLRNAIYIALNRIRDVKFFSGVSECRAPLKKFLCSFLASGPLWKPTPVSDCSNVQAFTRITAFSSCTLHKLSEDKSCFPFFTVLATCNYCLCFFEDDTWPIILLTQRPQYWPRRPSLGRSGAIPKLSTWLGVLLRARLALENQRGSHKVLRRKFGLAKVLKP